VRGDERSMLEQVRSCLLAPRLELQINYQNQIPVVDDLDCPLDEFLIFVKAG
jgi:hypothetical protein